MSVGRVVSTFSRVTHRTIEAAGPLLGAGERDGRPVLLYEEYLDVDSASGPEPAEVPQHGVESLLNVQGIARREREVTRPATRELPSASSAERAPQALALG